MKFASEIQIHQLLLAAQPTPVIGPDVPNFFSATQGKLIRREIELKHPALKAVCKAVAVSVQGENSGTEHHLGI